jgi:hypothetical protein
VSVAVVLALACSTPAAMEQVRVDATGRHFVLVTFGRRFVPWSLNYGCADKLIEEYWQTNIPQLGPPVRLRRW